jgi:hypothetical protein
MIIKLARRNLSLKSHLRTKINGADVEIIKQEIFKD